MVSIVLILQNLYTVVAHISTHAILSTPTWSLHTIQQCQRNLCRGVDSCFINIYGKVLSKRRANCQHNQPVLVQQARNLQWHLSKCNSNDLDVESNWLVYLTSFNNRRQANLYFIVILLCLCITLSCNFLTNTGHHEGAGCLYRGKFWHWRFLLLPVQCKLHILCVCNVCV